MGSLACVFSVLRVSGQLVGRILNGVTKYGQRTNIFTDRQKKVAPQTPLRPGLGLQPSDRFSAPPHPQTRTRVTTLGQTYQHVSIVIVIVIVIVMGGLRVQGSD